VSEQALGAPTAEETGLPGWYGKMPNLGDFASRRLPSRFIVPWDDWLQRSLTGSRALMGESWLATYLTSPLWRFLLMPGACGNLGWAGVLMPSVDRVGRHFPLSLAVELSMPPSDAAQLHALSAWLESMETAALATLDMNYTADDLDRALITNSLPALASPDDDLEPLQGALSDRLAASNVPSVALALPSMESFADVLSGAAIRAMFRGAAGKSLWWSRNRQEAKPVIFCCEGLPTPDDFALLLNGGTAPSAAIAMS